MGLVVRGATVVTPSGPAALDIHVEGGLVAALTAPEHAVHRPGEEVVDGTGLIAVPGGVDPHVHTNWVVPTAADAGIVCFGPDVVGRAAAYGGTTTLVDFAIWRPGGTLQDALVRKTAEWEGIAAVDFAFHITFNSGRIPPEVLDELPEVISAGQPSFKVWMTNTTPSRPRQKTDLGDVWALLRRLGNAGGILCVHAEDDDIVMYAYEELERTGRWSYEHVHLAHNKVSEAVSFARVIALAEHVGAPIYLMHVSAEEGVDAIRAARRRGAPVYGETLGHYAYFTAESYREPDGAKYHTYPSLKHDEDRAALWDGLLDGSISTLATDEMCTTLETKLRGKTVDDVTGGHAGVEVRMAVAYTEAVARRGASLNHFVDITSANAAKLLGMYPKKGAIAVGSDADLVLLDPTDVRTLSASWLHETDYTPWEGVEVRAWPKVTMLRGEVLVADGELVGPDTGGQLVTRAIAPGISSGAGLHAL